MSKDQLTTLFNKHIKNTGHKQKIVITEIDLGKISNSIKSGIGIYSTKVHMTSVALKHIYDKHIYIHNLKEDFYFILKNIRSVVQKPDLVTNNKPMRKGEYCFLKTIESQTIMCALQITNNKIYIVTAFILKDQGYLKGTSIIWKF